MGLTSDTWRYIDKAKINKTSVFLAFFFPPAVWIALTNRPRTSSSPLHTELMNTLIYAPLSFTSYTFNTSSP